MITRNLSTPESREFWAAAERAARRVATWPAWKLDVLEPRRAESMAKKKEVWVDNEDCNHDTELEALFADVSDAWEDLEPDKDNNLKDLSDKFRAAIDALHEYAHRDDMPAEVPETTTEGPLFRHCGVEPGDDWVTRVERLNDMIDGALIDPPRPTFDEIKALRVGDEVMISGSWFKVTRRVDRLVWVRLVNGMAIGFVFEELATVCQGIRRGE